LLAGGAVLAGTSLMFKDAAFETMLLEDALHHAGS
jgi:hypothetical protein